MLQLNFPSFQPHPPPVSSLVGAGVVPRPPQTHKRSSTFTRRIVEHGGNFHDTSIVAATKKKQIIAQHFENQFNSCDELISEWDEILADIKDIAQDVTTAQLVIVQQISEYYASLSIQKAYRGSIARYKLYVLKCERFLKRFIVFKRYFRKRVRAATRIKRIYRTYNVRQKFLDVIKCHNAAKLIQKNYRTHKKYRLISHSLKVLGFCKRNRDHVMLFGTRRALKRIMTERFPASSRCPEIIVRFIYKTFRRRRMRVLKGPLGKLSFYILSQFYTEGTIFPTNSTIDYIRQKVLVASLQNSTDVTKSLSARTSFTRGSFTTKRNSPLRISKGNMTEISKTASPDSSNTPVYNASHLPQVFSGIYRPKSIWQIYKLIRDLLYVAKQHPEVLDDSNPPAASVLMTLLGSRHTGSRRLRSTNSNSTTDMTDSNSTAKVAAPPEVNTNTASNKNKQGRGKPPVRGSVAKVPISSAKKNAAKQSLSPANSSSNSSKPALQRGMSQRGASIRIKDEELEEEENSSDDDSTHTTETDGSRSTANARLRAKSTDDDSVQSSISKTKQNKNSKEASESKSNKKKDNKPSKDNGKSIKTPSSAKSSKISTAEASNSTNSSPKASQCNSNQSSTSSLTPAPILGDRSRQASQRSMKSSSSRSLCNDSVDNAPREQNSVDRGDIAVTVSPPISSPPSPINQSAKHIDKIPLLKMNSNSTRIMRLQSRTNSSSSIKEEAEDHEDHEHKLDNISNTSPHFLQLKNPSEINFADDEQSAGEDKSVIEGTVIVDDSVIPAVDSLDSGISTDIPFISAAVVDNSFRSSVNALDDQQSNAIVELAQIAVNDTNATIRINSYNGESKELVLITADKDESVDLTERDFLGVGGYTNLATANLLDGKQDQEVEIFSELAYINELSSVLMSSVFRSSFDSHVIQASGQAADFSKLSAAEIKLSELDITYTGSAIDKSLANTLTFSECTEMDFGDTIDSPFKLLKEALNEIPSHFDDLVSPSKLTREDIHELLPINSMINDHVVSKAVKNLLMIKLSRNYAGQVTRSSISESLKYYENNENKTLEGQLDTMINQSISDNEEQVGGKVEDGEIDSLGHVSSISSVDWDLPEDVIESILGGNL